MPLQATSGAASYDAFGGGVPVVPAYIEEVFSTQVYTGTGATNNIVNGIDLAGKGGLVWTKARTTTSAFTFAHALMDTLRGAGIQICSDRTDANTTQANSLTSFNSDGYTLGADTGQGRVNNSSYGTQTYVGWTFRKQPKFFDVVTYTGNATSNRQIAHNLGSVPGCIIIKRTNDVGNWKVNHRSLAANQDLSLNLTNAADSANDFWDNTRPTSTHFTVGSLTAVNGNGDEFVAYLFAHNAGGFGLTGTDNVISCGSFTTDGSGSFSVDLGYEPQWLMIKSTNNTGVSSIRQNWLIYDTMRGLVAQPDSVGGSVRLFPNLSNAESASNELGVTATGFNSIGNQNPSTGPYIYIAIRRGPMKMPTSGTSVFKPNTTSAAAGTAVTTNFPVDLEIGNFLDNFDDKPFTDRLRGYATSTSSRTGAPFLNSPYTNAETTTGAPFSYNWWNKSVIIGNYISEYRQVSYYFGRAPSFFDEVCYTGTEVSGQTFNHNLGAVPEMMIVKSRSGTTDWTVYHSALGASARIYLNATNAANTGTAAPWNSTTPTSSVFSLGNAGATNLSGGTFVNYLFATCAGVSKVGSYTGTGTTKQIDCGFTGGARFVLIKRTDSTGAWYVWDSARGIVSGNDPYLLLNTTSPEVTNTDYIDTYSAGFEISSSAPAAINASGGSFIFLAIA